MRITEAVLLLFCGHAIAVAAGCAVVGERTGSVIAVCFAIALAAVAFAGGRGRKR